MKVLVFDTETTGLPPRNINKYKHGWFNYYPNIVQISWIFYDTEKDIFIDNCDYIIKLEDEKLIPEESIKIHNITNEIMNEKGVSIKLALDDFLTLLEETDIIVGHNIAFDLDMVLSEMTRHNFENIDLLKKQSYCTMKSSVDLCCIKKYNKYNNCYENKYPKLSELHSFLFGYVPNNLHNSFVDILITLRCYVMMNEKKDILNTCSKFKYYFTQYS